MTERIDDVSARVRKQIGDAAQALTNLETQSPSLVAQAGTVKATSGAMTDALNGWASANKTASALAHSLSTRIRGAYLRLSYPYIQRLLQDSLLSNVNHGSGSGSGLTLSQCRVLNGATGDAMERCDRDVPDGLLVRLEGTLQAGSDGGTQLPIHVHFTLRMLVDADNSVRLVLARRPRVTGEGLIDPGRIEQEIDTRLRQALMAPSRPSRFSLPFTPGSSDDHYTFTHEARFIAVDFEAKDDFVVSLRLTSRASGNKGSGDVIQIIPIASLPAAIDPRAADVVSNGPRPAWADAVLYLHLPKLGAVFGAELLRQIYLKNFKRPGVAYQGLIDDPRPGAARHKVMSWFAGFDAGTYQECVDPQCGWDNWSYRCHCNRTVTRTIPGMLGALGQFITTDTAAGTRLDFVVSFLGRSEKVTYSVPLGANVSRVEPAFDGDFATIPVAYAPTPPG